MMYLYGLDHVELGEHFMVLADCPLMCEGRSSLYGRWTSQDHGNNGDNSEETRDTRGEVELPRLNYGGFWIFIMGSQKMDEIHIMCDMYMDKVGIPMLITMSKE